MDEQTRSDLQQLLPVVEESWQPRSVPRTRQCLQDCMVDFVGHPTGWDDRIRDMSKALGFGGLEHMYQWNDDPGRTREQVVTRVRDALNV